MFYVILSFMIINLYKSENVSIGSQDTLYSFDIFDTLITRTTATPKGIFILVQKKLDKLANIPEFLKNNFVTIRMETEAYCRKNQFHLNQKFDCTFDDIYNVIQLNYNLSKEKTDEIKQIEIETELKNLVPIVENINKIKDLLTKQENIILISDMYYSEKILKNFLTHIDPVFCDIKIFTSGDTGKRKSNGSLYRLIDKQYKYKNKIHTGDNEFSDFIQAKWNNISAYKYNYEKLKPYEKFLLNNEPESVLAELSAGVSRILRLQNNGSKIFNFAVSYAAPILYGYIEWILEQCITRGITNLYFIARDGYIPKIIADILISKKKLDIKTHYFYSSRKAGRIPNDKNIEQYIKWIFSELKKSITPEFIAKRFNISLKELETFLNYKNPNKKLNEKDIKNCIKILSNSSEFKNLVIEKNKARKELYLNYLKQEIDFSKNNFAFVDMNGSGRTQDNLGDLISDFCKYPIISFYFHVQADMKQTPHSIKLAYIHTSQYISMAIELLCRTDSGQTLGYKNTEGTLIPVLEYETNSYIKKWGYVDYINGIKAYTLLFNEYLNINNLNMNDIKIYINYFKFLRDHLDKETADILGSIPFGVYGNEKKIIECAPKFTFYNLLNNKTAFRFISICRSNYFIKNLLKIFDKISNKTNYGYISSGMELAYIKILNYKFDISKWYFNKQEQKYDNT